MTGRKLSTKDLVECSLFTALIAIGAFIKIVVPLGPYQVTISLQLLFSLLAGFLLGSYKGFLSVLTYIFLGLIGIPIFAHGGGPSYLLRPTFGFIIGFASSALVAGYFSQNFYSRSLRCFSIGSIIGMLSYYLAGLLYFYLMTKYVLVSADAIGFKELISIWFLSSLIPDSIISLFAGFLAKRLGTYY